MNESYRRFLDDKRHVGAEHGFEPLWMPECLFPFQVALTEWAIRKGRAAIFADCGLGKTFMQIVWAENVVRKTGSRVLILAPLAVGFQTVLEGEKLGIEVQHRREGLLAGDRIVVTNYQRLHYFNPEDFGGVVCDESSILKNFDGATRQAITEFMRVVPYRLLCTATAAPNDYIELGTSSEALGEMGFADMVSRFFTKAKRTYSRRQEHQSGTYRFRGHAETDFWRWVCSWARAMRWPSDLGFEDKGFKLPPLNIRKHKVESRTRPDEMLFDLPAHNLTEQRRETRRTLPERCEQAASLINAHKDPAVAWCCLNDESSLLAKMIPDAVEVVGGDSDERKESTFRAFAEGKVRVVVTKPTIAGFGLNWQHCAHATMFPSHSYEQFYQATRRCWRFGQRREVTIDLVYTEGQAKVLQNLERKSEAASVMFDHLVALMRNELRIKRVNDCVTPEEVPRWLSRIR